MTKSSYSPSVERRVAQVSDLLTTAMRTPAAGANVCPRCFQFFDAGRFDCCWSCGQVHDHLDAFVPISYVMEGGQLHDALRGYKDSPFRSARTLATKQLTAVLWRFLQLHERCVAKAAGVDAFDLVCVVPSKTAERDAERPGLRTIVGTMCWETADRYERLLTPGATPPDVAAHEWAPDRFVCSRPLDGDRVLLVDDTWTTGANAQSAALQLKRNGASAVACVTVGRYIRPDWDFGSGEVAEDRYKALPAFSWADCARHT